MAKISLWVGDGCLASSATTLIDAFSIADLWHSAAAETPGPLFETEIISTDGRPVTAYGNLRMEADRSAVEVEATDCLVISPVIPSITKVPENLTVLARHLNRLRRQGTTVATVCTGSFVLAEMGLLDGKKATGELPLKYLQRVRIDAAKERLETTRDSIDRITWAVGYKDVSSFCRLFKQRTQISPRAYRDKFYARVPF